MSEKQGQYGSEPPPQYTAGQPGPTQYQGQYQNNPYPPQGQPAYPPQGQPAYPPQGQGTVVVGIPAPVRYGPSPMQLHCPTCNQTVLSKIEYENGLMVWISVGIICLFGGIFGFCLIPFCIKDLKNVKHTCPNDNTYLGLYDRTRGF